VSAGFRSVFHLVFLLFPFAEGTQSVRAHEVFALDGTLCIAKFMNLASSEE